MYRTSGSFGPLGQPQSQNFNSLYMPDDETETPAIPKPFINPNKSLPTAKPYEP